MTPFSSKACPRLFFGMGAREKLGEAVDEIGGRRVLVVTDRGIRGTGRVDEVVSFLNGREVEVFDRVIENPTTEVVADCVEVARDFKPDILLGVGGGSSMDTAKGCNFIFSNGGEMSDYLGYGKAPKPMLPLVAMPTTAGTGSECQSYALISDKKTHLKMACGDPKALARVAVLDPELTLTQPDRVAACTGIDALAHALETFVTRKRSDYSALFSAEAVRLILKSFRRVMSDGSDLEAREGMQLGAAYAGIAIENSMLGCAHSCANPLTAKFGIVHGQAVGAMLSPVLRFNAEDAGVCEAYAELAKRMGLAERSAEPEDAFEGLHQEVRSLLQVSGLKGHLSELEVTSEDIEELAAMAAKQWTAQFNPRQVSPIELAEIYEGAL